MSGIDRRRVTELMERERLAFVQAHPRSRALFDRSRHSLLGGVPMNWMAKWPGGFPVFVESAGGAHFTCVDAHDYIDFCLGDTGAMTGHAPEASVSAIREGLARGMTLMLPTEDAPLVGEELARRFGLPTWQFALTATDANRFALRLARYVTRRPKVLVFDYCYHGTVDESFATLAPDGSVVDRDGAIGPPVPASATTRVVEWNDVPALEAALADAEVAAVLAEPVMTNVGIVHPDEGYHAALREVTRRTGTLLILDETHTICAGPGGCTAAWGLEPDMLVIGKPIAAGLPSAAYGMTAEVADRIRIDLETSDVGGIGGTLAGNALSLAATRATLAEVLTEDAFARMIPLAERWTDGVETAIREAGLPWHVTRLGARAEYLFGPDRPRNGREAAAMDDFGLQQLTHLYALNRGILLTPFHNMALMSPATADSDVDRHTAVFSEMAAELTG
ncbi:MAG: transaminase [Chloroflexota bacterium]|nr:transaminase [Chloroflexota bacterium]